MQLTYVIVTHNRRDVLLRTLEILFRTTPLHRKDWEAYVVDNGSTDGTIPAVWEQFPQVRTIQRRRNEGAWARSYAFGVAHAPYLVLLDDDSYPLDDAVPRSIAYLESHHNCAAVAGRVVHPDQTEEACAFPSVMLSGAVCLRREIVDRVGTFGREFFRKAGEYDFCFRIWQEGYSIDRLEDVVYCHDKSPAARSDFLAHRMDVRNNLILAQRYLPDELRECYVQDWRQRYASLARHAGQGLAARVALAEAKIWGWREARRGRRVLSARALENIFGFQAQADNVGLWALTRNIRQVAIADFGKNIYATYRACQTAGLEVTAVIDANPAFAGQRYRGIPIVTEAKAQGIVISNINPAQVDGIEQRLRKNFAGPILRLWQAEQEQLLRQAA